MDIGRGKIQALKTDWKSKSRSINTSDFWDFFKFQIPSFTAMATRRLPDLPTSVKCTYIFSAGCGPIWLIPKEYQLPNSGSPIWAISTWSGLISGSSGNFHQFFRERSKVTSRESRGPMGDSIVKHILGFRCLMGADTTNKTYIKSD